MYVSCWTTSTLFCTWSALSIYPCLDIVTIFYQNSGQRIHGQGTLMSYILTSFFASFLPSQITTAILPYLSANLPSIFPPAPKGSPRYLYNYRLAFTGVICIWQAYSFFKDGMGNEDDWYRLLSVQGNADEDALKSAFRTLYVQPSFPDV